MNPQEIEALIDAKIKEHMEPVESKLDAILTLLAKFEGAGTVMKFLFLGVAPVVAGIAWIKNHVNF